MAHPALIEALRRRIADDVDAVWQKARADAEKLRADSAHIVEEQRARHRHDREVRSATAARAATAAADAKAREVRAAAKSAMAERLRRLAGAALPGFRKDRYADLFAALARELPERPWTRVTVNPKDETLARDALPGVDVVSDATVTGGMTVEGGGVWISNTLDTRLEAAWPDLLPDLMTDVLEEASHS